MATNEVFVPGNRFSAVCSDPATPTSGAPVIVGQIPGVALVDEGEGGNVAGETTITTEGIWDLSVKGENNAGNTAVAVGDILYYDSAATVKINKDNTNGVRYGYALEAVTSGSTATIRVKLGY